MVHILTKETSSGLMPTTFSYKAAVKCATIATGTLATAFAAGQLVDGYTLITGDRILIKDQSTASQNGVYTVNATGAPTRATDMNAATMFPGAVVAVEQGTINADSGWVCTADSGIVLETSDIVWAIFGGVKAGLGLTITADVISVTALNLGTLAGLVGVTGTPTLAIGTYDTPKVVATATDYIATTIYIQSSANAPSDDTSVIGLYCKVENTTISQPHNHLQAGLFNTNIRFNMFDAYAVQGHVTVSANVGTQNANAHVTGISGKFVATGGTTLATGWATGGLFIVEGTGAVTQMCSVVSLVQEAGCGACQEMLYINNDGTATKGIVYIGNFTNVLTFGTSSAQIALNTAGQRGIDMYISSTAASDTTYGEYIQLSGSGAAEYIAGRHKTLLTAAGVGNAHGHHGTLELDTSAGSVIGLGSGIRANLVLPARAIPAGTYYGAMAEISIPASGSLASCPLSAILEIGTTGGDATAQKTIKNAISFDTLSTGTGNMIYIHTAAGTQVGTIRVVVNGTPYWLPLMQAE